MKRYSRVFAALDGWQTQEYVVKRAIAIASTNKAELMFGHVVDCAAYETGSIDYASLKEEGESRIRESVQSILNEYEGVDAIPSIDVKACVGILPKSLEDELIVPFSPDLVICGVRGLSNISYALVGSVSKYLIRNLKCDVLVAKDEG